MSFRYFILTSCCLFSLNSVYAREYVIFNSKTNKCLDLKDWDGKKDKKVCQRTYSGAASQIWDVTRDKWGTYTIQNKKTGHYMEISGGNGDEGKEPHTYHFTGAPWQRWRLGIRPYGMYMKNKHTEKHLEVKEGDLSEDAVIHQTDNKKTGSEKSWIMIPTKNYGYNEHLDEILPEIDNLEGAIKKIIPESFFNNPVHGIELVKNIDAVRPGPIDIQGGCFVATASELEISSREKSFPDGSISISQSWVIHNDQTVDQGTNGIALLLQKQYDKFFPKGTRFSFSFDYNISDDSERIFKIEMVEYSTSDSYKMRPANTFRKISRSSPEWYSVAEPDFYTKKSEYSVVAFYITWDNTSPSHDVLTELSDIKVIADF